MTWDPQPPRQPGREVPAHPAHLGSLRLPAVRVVLVSEQAKGETALAVVDRLLARLPPGDRDAGWCGPVVLSDVEWAALRHMEAMAARVAQNPGLRRLGFKPELSPYLRALLESGLTQRREDAKN